MKDLLISIFILVFFANCNAQKILVENLSKNKELNYTLALIEPTEITSNILYNSTMYITVYRMNDPIATPDKFSVDTHESLSSFMVSVKSDDTYINSNDSKLIKITGMYNPKILEIKELTYPKFFIKIEHGVFNNRKIETYKLEGI
jgi:hypothetical protein